MSAVFLLRSKSDHRIHARGAVSWNEARQHGNQSEQRRHGEEGQRIERLDLEQQVGHQPCQRERTGGTDDDTGKGERRRLPHDHSKNV